MNEFQKSVTEQTDTLKEGMDSFVVSQFNNYDDYLNGINEWAISMALKFDTYEEVSNFIHERAMSDFMGEEDNSLLAALRNERVVVDELSCEDEGFNLMDEMNKITKNEIRIPRYFLTPEESALIFAFNFKDVCNSEKNNEK